MPAWRMRRAASAMAGRRRRACRRARRARRRRLRRALPRRARRRMTRSRLSDVYSFSGTGADIFVLELSMSSVEAGSYLAWLDTATNQWVNAVEGNTGNKATAAQQGSRDRSRRSQSIYGTDLYKYIGPMAWIRRRAHVGGDQSQQRLFHRAGAVDVGAAARGSRRLRGDDAAPEDGGSRH